MEFPLCEFYSINEVILLTIERNNINRGILWLIITNMNNNNLFLFCNLILIVCVFYLLIFKYCYSMNYHSSEYYVMTAHNSYASNYDNGYLMTSGIIPFEFVYSNTITDQHYYTIYRNTDKISLKILNANQVNTSVFLRNVYYFSEFFIFPENSFQY